MDYNKALDDIGKYCDPFSILAIKGRQLVKISCPFRVKVLEDYSKLKKGDIVSVEKVMVTRDLKMVYIINGAGYYFDYFLIMP